MAHPAAKSMIELSRAQDEEVGDGTTSVIILSELVVLLLPLMSSSLPSSVVVSDKKETCSSSSAQLCWRGLRRRVLCVRVASLARTCEGNHDVTPRLSRPSNFAGTPFALFTAGEMLSVAEPILSRGVHPTQVHYKYDTLDTCTR